MRYVAIVLFGALLFGFTIGYTGNTETAIRITGEMTKYFLLLLRFFVRFAKFLHQIIKNIKNLYSNRNEFIWFSSLMNVGAMAGALGAAPIANGVGRRKCLIATGVVFALGYALLAFCHGFPALLIARMITGLGSGMASFIVPLYIAEVAKTSRRGTLGASNQLAIVVGIFLAYGLASWIQMDAPTGDAIPPDFTNNLDGKPPPTKVCNYQVFSGVIACIGGLLAGLSFFVPETPRWLFMKSRTQDGEWALQKLRGDDYLEERQHLVSAAPATEEAAESLWDYKRQLFIGVMLQVFQQFSGVNNIMFYLTSILENNGVSNPEMYSTITMLLQIIFTAISCVLMDKAGRRGLLMVSQFGLAVGMGFFSSKFLFNVDGKLFQTFSLQIWNFLAKEIERHVNLFSVHTIGNGGSVLSISAAFVFIISFSMGVGGIPWLILAELFPTSIRGKASSIAVCTNWTSSFIVTLSFTPLVNTIGEAAGFGFYACCCVAGIIFTFFFVPETKGKSLEEIEREMRGGARSALIGERV